MAIVRLVAVTFLMATRSSSWILTRAFMTTKITSVCDGVHLGAISATCLVLLRETCETVITLFHATRHDLVSALLFYPFYHCLTRGQLARVCTLCDLIHVRCDAKGSSLRLSLLSPSC